MPAFLVLQGLIAGVLLGLNTTVFAYGATGSGKTYTMVGSPTDPGIMVLSMSDIFAFMVRSAPPLHLAWVPALAWGHFVGLEACIIVS